MGNGSCKTSYRGEFLVFYQRLSGQTSCGDVMEENSESVRVGESVHFEPEVEGCGVVLLELDRNLFGEGALIVRPERGANRRGKYLPDFPAEQ